MYRQTPLAPAFRSCFGWESANPSEHNDRAPGIKARTSLADTPGWSRKMIGSAAAWSMKTLSITPHRVYRSNCFIGCGLSLSLKLGSIRTRFPASGSQNNKAEQLCEGFVSRFWMRFNKLGLLLALLETGVDSKIGPWHD
jgi:hypothetical protein